MSLYCWWFGCCQHDQDPTPPEYATCFRCGESVSYAHMVGDTPHGAFMAGFRDAVRCIFPRKCPDCGRRYRACDESVDHIPF